MASKIPHTLPPSLRVNTVWLAAAATQVPAPTARSEAEVVEGRPALQAALQRVHGGGGLLLLVLGSVRANERERAPLLWRIGRRLKIVLSAPVLRLQARRAEQVFARSGRSTRRLELAERNSGYVLTTGRRLSTAVRVVVVGEGASAPTLLERVTDAAGQALDEELRIAEIRVLAAGGLMVECERPSIARSALIRVAELAADDRSATVVDHLLRHASPKVSNRLVRRDAVGVVERLRWSVEPKLSGTHPLDLTAALWRQCAGFLTALAEAPPLPTAACQRTLPELAERMFPALEQSAVERVRCLAELAEARLAQAPRCWAHGDFHPANILVDGGRLVAVLDWDGSSSASIPGLDLLHLLATTDPTLRRLTLGSRCEGALLEILRSERGADIRGRLGGLGIRAETAELRALVVAYWITRVVRDLEEFADRRERPAWLEANLRGPAMRIEPW